MQRFKAWSRLRDQIYPYSYFNQYAAQIDDNQSQDLGFLYIELFLRGVAVICH